MKLVVSCAAIAAGFFLLKQSCFSPDRINLLPTNLWGFVLGMILLAGGFAIFPEPKGGFLKKIWDWF